MWDKALEIASHVEHPIPVAAVALVIAAYLFSTALKKRRSGVTWPLVGVILIIGLVILILGLSPLASSTFLQTRNLYIVRVFVLGLDKQPVDNARVTSSIGGEAKKIQGGWEFDIPPQAVPADGNVVLFASVESAFLTGNSTVVLSQDYYPTTTIQLTSDTSARVRGVVVDEHRRSVAGAHVSITGYPDSTVTDQMGNFTLAAHAADGQIVQVRAQKDQLVGVMSIPAGKPVELVVRRP